MLDLVPHVSNKNQTFVPQVVHRYPPAENRAISIHIGSQMPTVSTVNTKCNTWLGVFPVAKTPVPH